MKIELAMMNGQLHRYVVTGESAEIRHAALMQIDVLTALTDVIEPATGHLPHTLRAAAEASMYLAELVSYYVHGKRELTDALACLRGWYHKLCDERNNRKVAGNMTSEQAQRDMIPDMAYFEFGWHHLFASLESRINPDSTA